MNILEMVKMELNMKGITNIDENQVRYLIDKYSQFALNYCNLYKLPNECNYIIVDLVVNSIVKNSLVLKSTQNIDDNANIDNLSDDNIASISEGGRSVSFNTSKSSNTQSTLNSLYDISIENEDKFKQQLNKFKRLYK